jgi:carboxyl-terminal processing protease
MHQRTWLSILTLPFVTAFTYPMVVRQTPPAARVESAPSVKDPLAGLADVQDVLSLVRDNYVDVPDLEKVIRGGIEGVLEQAHPMNAYLTPEDVRLPDPGPGQVGLTVLKKTIWAQVLAVTPGSPAAAAGIQVGDVIRKIDGASIGSMSAWTLERSLRGPVGSKLELVRYDSSNGQLKKISLDRAVVSRPAMTLRKDPKATLVQLPDLSAGRAMELKQLLQGADRGLPLVLDLRNCAGGELAEAVQVAQVLGGPGGTLATIQESGKPDRTVSVAASAAPGFGSIAVLLGLGTVGPAEGLASYLKKESILTIGERSAGLGLERTRFPLRQGGAVELVNRRWLGAGGEKLDRQGVVPSEALRGLQPGEDPLPKVLEILAAPVKKAS